MSIFPTEDGQRLVIGSGMTYEQVCTALDQGEYGSIVLLGNLDESRKLLPLIERSRNAKVTQVWLNQLRDYREGAEWILNRIGPATTGDIYVLVPMLQKLYWAASVIKRAEKTAPQVRWHLL